MNRKIIKIGILIVVFIICVVYFSPKPLVRNVENSDIISVMYRDDTWEELRFFYPSQAVPFIDEGELLRILNQSKAVIEVFSPTVIDGIPSDVVTLLISVGDGDSTKYIILGDWNRVIIQGRSTSYRIINANSVLNRVLNFLQIDEDTDMSKI